MWISVKEVGPIHDGFPPSHLMGCSDYEGNSGLLAHNKKTPACTKQKNKQANK